MNINELKVTPWSADTDVPARVGVYEIKPEISGSHRNFAYWDGVTWSRDATNPADALSNHGYVRESQRVAFRGVMQ